MDLMQILKALGDETRIRILNLLKNGELCVCELEEIMDIKQSNASRHLDKLTNAKLVSYEKRALYVYYKLNDKLLEEHKFLQNLIYSEFERLEKCKTDDKKLCEYKKSGKNCDDLKKGKAAVTSCKNQNA